MTQASKFKFAKWLPNTTKLTAKDKPFDVCAPVSDKERFVPLNQRNMDMIHNRKDEILKLFKAEETKNKNATVDMKDMPKVISVKLGNLMIVTDSQRNVDEDHVIYNIMVPFVPKFFTTPRGAWDPIRKMYCITEGQHRIIALRDRIRLGKVKNVKPDDWEQFEIEIQIVTLEVKNGIVNYGPERRMFIIENGEKLPVTQIDKFKNEVHGKNMDSPNEPTYEDFERSAAIYSDMCKANVTPTGTEGKDATKPGAFKHIAYVRADGKGKGNKTRLTRTQLKTIYKYHNTYSLHEAVAAIEMIPILTLISEIENHSWLDKTDKVKVAEVAKFHMSLNATVHSVWYSWDAYMKYAQKLWNRRCAKTKVKESVPPDWSLALLIQLVGHAGYSFPGIDGSWYVKYTGPSGWDCLTAEEQALFV